MTAERALAKATLKKSHGRAVFPTPGHDHDRCASDAIAHAEATCAAHKEKLTPIRREQGLAHRIESRNAFIACAHNHESGDPVVFLICEKCGAVGEAASAAVAETIRNASRAAGFAPKTPVIEISGICVNCRAA